MRPVPTTKSHGHRPRHPSPRSHGSLPPFILLRPLCSSRSRSFLTVACTLSAFRSDSEKMQSGNAGWEGTTAAAGVSKKHEFGRFRAFMSDHPRPHNSVGAPKSTVGSDVRPNAMQWSVAVPDAAGSASPNQRQTTGQPWQTRQGSEQASIRLQQSLKSASHSDPRALSAGSGQRSSSLSLEASPSKQKVLVPKLWREGASLDRCVCAF